MRDSIKRLFVVDDTHKQRLIEFSAFFSYTSKVHYLISGSSTSPETSLHARYFLIHITTESRTLLACETSE